MKIELPPPIPCKRERPPKHSAGKQTRVKSQATASLGRTIEQLDEDRGPKAPEAPEREQKPAISEPAHRASPPPVPPPRSPKEAAREQAPSPTPPSFGSERGNSSTWRLFGYVTALVVCLLVVLAILSSLRLASRTTAGTQSPRPSPSPTPNASPTESPRPSPSPTPNASPTQSPRPSPSPTPNASPTQSPRPSPSPTYRVELPSGGFLNMRQGPGISFPVVQRLQHGVDGVTLIGKPVTNASTRWQKINSRGVVGWVNADYLVPSRGGPSSEGLPPGFVWETTPAPGTTPTPVRRAIEDDTAR